MNNSILVAKLSVLLEDEEPLVSEMILETVQEVESKSLSVEAHIKKTERSLDQKLRHIGEDNQ